MRSTFSIFESLRLLWSCSLVVLTFSVALPRVAALKLLGEDLGYSLLIWLLICAWVIVNDPDHLLLIRCWREGSQLSSILYLNLLENRLVIVFQFSFIFI